MGELLSNTGVYILLGLASIALVVLLLIAMVVLLIWALKVTNNIPKKVSTPVFIMFFVVTVVAFVAIFAHDSAIREERTLKIHAEVESILKSDVTLKKEEVSSGEIKQQYFSKDKVYDVFSDSEGSILSISTVGEIVYKKS